ncbi:MAG: penicillin-binding protein [Rickettsiaceae bacterium]|nr:penicillin-binding protein [Rickettsiaceae bacterium]
MSRFFSKWVNILAAAMTLLFIGVFAATLIVFYLVFHFGADLPDYSQLANYSPPTVTRLYAADGRLMEEYAKEKRLFVPINAIPKRVSNAFLSAEDKNFYKNPGIDLESIIRAAFKNIANMGNNKSLVGGSTITQQVVKNFLLSNEKSLDRKIKEAILSFRITQSYPKDKILELYLNEIYLGNRSYGVAAAALDYFNKSMDELTIEEAAMLASLPKAPSSLDPRKFPDKAKARRDWVIGRMVEDGYINEVEALLAMSKPITVVNRDATEIVSNASFFAEEVRQKMAALYGEQGVYENGLAVRTTLKPELQTYAQNALRNGLVSYDRRHGYRGPIKQITDMENWKDSLNGVTAPASLGVWKLAVVLKNEKTKAQIGFKDGSTGEILLENMKWARKYISEDRQDGAVKQPSDILAIGDVIAVSANEDDKKTVYKLEQIPKINGAIVAMDPHSGRVLALVGGYYYGDSQFNRATQAKRQPGSAFKPFVYLSALENGFSPNSIILDEPVELDMGQNQPGWSPQNYSGDFYGPTTLRVGVEKSRNAMTVRLAQALGIDKVIEVAKRFGINDNPQRNFSMVLGTAETTLLNLTNAYAMLVNGGKRVSPSLIERIQDRNGKTIFKMDNRDCPVCLIVDDSEKGNLINPPSLEDNRETIAPPIETFQMVSILEGVVQRGTAIRLRDMSRSLAGKTGTTNDSFDTWFMGFSADLVVGVYVGFDNPASLGKFETGSAVALPIWKEFMEHALANTPDVPFRRPSGVKVVKINAKTGLLPTPDTPKRDIIYESFKEGTEPGIDSVNLPIQTNDEQPDFGAEGVY